jgi:hypothetical protein
MPPNLEYRVNLWKSTKFEYWLGVTKHVHLNNPKWVQHLQILINKIEPVGGIWWYNGNVGGWSPNFETAYAVMFGDTQLIDMWVPLYLQFSLWWGPPVWMSWFTYTTCSLSPSLSLSHFLNEGRGWFHGCIWLSKEHGCIYGMDLGRCSQAPTLPLACSFLLMSLHQACLRHAQLLQAAAWFVKMYEQELPTKALWRLFSPSLSIYTCITNTYIYMCAVVFIYI